MFEIKNAIDYKNFCKIEEILNQVDFPFYRSNLDYDNSGNFFLYQWHHLLKANDRPISNYCNQFEDIIFQTFFKQSLSISKILRMRLGYHTITPENFFGGPHVDFPLYHKVGLIYLNNSDGDTKIFNERYDFSSGIDHNEYIYKILNNKFSLKSKHCPEKNKLIIFDGSFYHSSATPRYHKNRIVLNINFV